LISAVTIVRMLAAALASFAAILARSKFGIAIAATTSAPEISDAGIALTSRIAVLSPYTPTTVSGCWF
jgi:hypothetical protein